ncbi:TetR family transcriptional regulator [Phaeovulum sp. W22_SRMD_FR3]|uniref:TetR/AcrR family transcriptional regulator n=1 Tax=Phaeovulum sp. W22_SRMD_FR3 TaxID=3240274 RepID=UPI003F94EEE0
MWIVKDRPATNSKTGRLDAALSILRAKGDTATGVEQLCAEAGASKGSFFHPFACKDALMPAAAAHWDEVPGGLFVRASCQHSADPPARLPADLDLRKDLLTGDLPDVTCFADMITQKAHDTPPEIAPEIAATCPRAPQPCQNAQSGHRPRRPMVCAATGAPKAAPCTGKPGYRAPSFRPKPRRQPSPKGRPGRAYQPRSREPSPFLVRAR